MWSLLFFLAILKNSFAEIPKASCSVKDPALNQCLKTFAEKYVPLVAADGIPELGLMPLDPFLIPNMAFDFNSNMIKGTVEIRKGVLKGLRNAKVLKLNVNINDPRRMFVNLEGFAEKLLLEGEYKGDTRLARMDVSGQGSFKILLEGMNVKVRAAAAVVTGASGESYLDMKEVDITPSFTNMKIKVDGLMPGNPDVADTAIRMLNQQWKEFYGEMLPFLKPRINAIVLQSANQYVKKIPIQNVIQDYPGMNKASSTRRRRV